MPSIPSSRLSILSWNARGLFSSVKKSSWRASARYSLLLRLFQRCAIMCCQGTHGHIGDAGELHRELGTANACFSIGSSFFLDSQREGGVATRLSPQLCRQFTMVEHDSIIAGRVLRSRLSGPAGSLSIFGPLSPTRATRSRNMHRLFWSCALSFRSFRMAIACSWVVSISPSPRKAECKLAGL
eukprot:9295708-Pyramimonas_sp.AAC.1